MPSFFNAYFTLAKFTLAAALVAATQFGSVNNVQTTTNLVAVNNQASIAESNATSTLGADLDVPTLIKEISAENGLTKAQTNQALEIAHCESHYRQFDSKGDILRGEKNPAGGGR